MTPLLPVEDVPAFADRLLETGVERYVVQPFHAERGRFVAGTRQAAVEATERLGWTEQSYRRAVEELRRRLPQLLEGKAGFEPV